MDERPVTSMNSDDGELVTVETEKEHWGPEAFPSHKLAAWGIGEEVEE